MAAVSQIHTPAENATFTWLVFFCCCFLRRVRHRCYRLGNQIQFTSIRKVMPVFSLIRSHSRINATAFAEEGYKMWLKCLETQSKLTVFSNKWHMAMRFTLMWKGGNWKCLNCFYRQLNDNCTSTISKKRHKLLTLSFYFNLVEVVVKMCLP